MPADGTPGTEGSRKRMVSITLLHFKNSPFPINILTVQSLGLEIISSHRSPLSPGLTLAGVDGSHFICKTWVTPTLFLINKTADHKELCIWLGSFKPTFPLYAHSNRM